MFHTMNIVLGELVVNKVWRFIYKLTRDLDKNRERSETFYLVEQLEQTILAITLRVANLVLEDWNDVQV